MQCSSWTLTHQPAFLIFRFRTAGGWPDPFFSSFSLLISFMADIIRVLRDSFESKPRDARMEFGGDNRGCLLAVVPLWPMTQLCRCPVRSDCQTLRPGTDGRHEGSSPSRFALNSAVCLRFPLGQVPRANDRQGTLVLSHKANLNYAWIAAALGHDTHCLGTSHTW